MCVNCKKTRQICSPLVSPENEVWSIVITKCWAEINKKLLVAINIRDPTLTSDMAKIVVITYKRGAILSPWASF